MGSAVIIDVLKDLALEDVEVDFLYGELVLLEVGDD